MSLPQSPADSWSLQPSRRMSEWCWLHLAVHLEKQAYSIIYRVCYYFALIHADLTVENVFGLYSLEFSQEVKHTCNNLEFMTTIFKN